MPSSKKKLNRIQKPITRRGKKFLLSKEPRLKENDKTALFVRGKNCSQTVTNFMKDLATLKGPDCQSYGRKNDIYPFEDVSSIEYFSRKEDHSLFCFGSSNKKRPDNVIFGRMFNYQLLDMIEVGVNGYCGIDDKKSLKCTVGNKPCLLFAGESFDTQLEYQRFKNLLIDFFRGPVVSNIYLAGLDHVLMFVAVGDVIHLRTYSVQMKKSGSNIPRIELLNMGPSADFTMRRTKIASEHLYELATKMPPRLKKSARKNISRDKLGTQFGRVHLQKMDLKKLNLRRRLKALKKSPSEKIQEKKFGKKRTMST